ncbi:MAG: DUF1223 domain-containing protein [Hyphomicrobiaceae bacterium]
MANAEPVRVRAVVELFTSQGCSSCPPADSLIGKLDKRADVLALSLPVDYWDYLGWKDTLAQHAFTERQREYADQRGDGLVYTPQVVVNGLKPAVGSHEAQVEAAIEETAKALEGKRPTMDVAHEGDTLVVSIGAAPAGAPVPMVVWLAHLTRDREVTIGRGENDGQIVTYHNVVRKLTAIGTWSGEALTLRVPMAEVRAVKSDAGAVLLQAKDLGPILAAAEIASW